jgi:Predicted exporters of the RND superfamily
MWKHLAKFVLRFRLVLLIILLALTGLMAYYASKVKISYEFGKAIPTDNPKYQEYLSFRAKFGEDANLVVIGVQTDKFFELNTFNAFTKLTNELKTIPHVEDVLSIGSAVNLMKDTAEIKLISVPIFPKQISTQQQLDSTKNIFLSLPFYKTILYNPESNAYLIAVRVNKDAMASSLRSEIINNIISKTNAFTSATKIETHLSGLPLIKTLVADRIKREMKWFLLGSLALSAFILLIFFRSVSTTLLSLTVVLVGVIWSFGILYLFGYKITLLTALIPPLVVVIGIPNCIYFLNKYHSSYRDSNNKKQSLIDMVSKMGVVTLFCNIAAAIGFAVFSLTKSSILKEFGTVSGISIMMIFVVSFILLPGVLSYLPAPKKSQLKYLDNPWLTALLVKIEEWALHHKKVIYITTLVVVAFSIVGVIKLRSEAFMVEDLPESDKIYSDLKFFEKNFRGIMPLEIVIDTYEPNGIRKRGLEIFEKMDSLSQYISQQKEMARPLSVAEALKFIKQGVFEGDTANYMIPNTSDFLIMAGYFKFKKDTSQKGGLASVISSFIDTSNQTTRISVNMADVGTVRLPEIIKGIKAKSDQLFDRKKYNVQFTGSSITFLEGSKFIIDGLKQSILWAFLLIALCMLYLFKSLRILFCSLIPNVIPLIVTAGIMGWIGIRLKPSTVLIFSVALGIAIDVTIRFLVNYKQELPHHNNNVIKTVGETIKHTGLSILYTSMVLIAGFIIFCFSGFGGTQALGWLTSLTLLVATLTNLILLPVLLLIGSKKQPIEVNNDNPLEV